MISLLVSSKTMESRRCPFDAPHTTARFRAEATELNELLKKYTPLQLKRLMHISPKLAEATQERIAAWGNLEETPAWYTFIGDVYTGLKISEFNKEDLLFAQQHLGTPSGLYGLLRPLDLIHPYRLELGYKVKGRVDGRGFKDLYDFWGDTIAKTIPKDEVVINLSSEEYIKTLRPYLPESQIITPWFMQTKNKQPDFQAVHAKMARGMMVRWITKNRVNDPVALKNFDYGGYSYKANLSKPTKPLFIRPENYDFRADY